MDDLEQVIWRALDKYSQIVEKQQLSDGQWTKEIFAELGSIGKGRGYKICASGFKPEFEAEWLFDMTWYKYNGDKSLSIGLVAESEWSYDRNEIKWDFEKLLAAKADHRLMIFQSSTEGIKEIIENFKEEIRNFMYSYEGDRWLFVTYDWDTERFDHKSYIHKC